MTDLTTNEPSVIAAADTPATVADTARSVRAAGPEAVREAGAREDSKHARVIRSARDGRILSAIMLPLFTLRPPAGYGILTTAGRRTGKRRRKCVRVIRRGDRAYLMMLRPPKLAIERPTAVAAWVWNIRADPRVELRLPDGTFEGLARELHDPEELEQARAALCETVTWFDYGECDLHLRGLPTRAKIEDLHRYWFQTGIPLAVELRARTGSA
jgi:deazaflavin-dependent oxidoreductase (nitroreductase family)